MIVSCLRDAKRKGVCFTPETLPYRARLCLNDSSGTTV